MKGIQGFLIALLIIFIFFFVQSRNAKKAKNERLQKRLREAFGSRPDREYGYEEYERIRFYFDKMSQKGNADIIDDITWNDLSMDSVFKLINNTNSSVGEEYLYRLLRTLNFDKESLEEFDGLTEYFLKNPNKAKEVQSVFARLGRTRSISFFDFIHRLTDVQVKSNLIHYLCAFLGLATVGLFFVSPAIAVFALVFVFSFNIFMYYREKGSVESYFVCCKYLVGLVEAADKVSELNIEMLSDYCAAIKSANEELKYLRHNMYLISDGTMNESIIGIVMEYVKMIFHVDLIKFNSIVKQTVVKLEHIDRLYEAMGRIEAVMAVASFKLMLVKEYGAYAKPVIERNGAANIIEFENIYHPMIENAVKNSMKSEKTVLLTGSNASGKSTFLKTAAINAILAQTLSLACADSFRMGEAMVYSSMALRDDLESNESYYIVEIKSLKRILDAAGRGRRRVLCFIDEVLRGTNTVERIAASSVILEELSLGNTICFAATHDIELTYILKNCFENYHFEEEVSSEDVLFNYELQYGPATTRNAIKLLKMTGYREEITKNAAKRAEGFLKNGSWM